MLLVAKRDRLARDTMVAAMVERLAQRDAASIVAADGTGNGDGPEALLMRRLIDAFAEYERALIRARTRSALAVKRGRGERVGHVGFGYRLACDGVHLERHEAEQAVLTVVREYLAEGLTVRAIGKRLTERGVVPRSGGKWHPQTVARVIDAARSAA